MLQLQQEIRWRKQWHNSEFYWHLRVKNNSSMKKVCRVISREVDPNIKRSIEIRGLVVFTWNCVFENLNTRHSKVDLIFARLCFDTAFSSSWLQSKSSYSSVMLIPTGENEWVIQKSDGWTAVGGIGHAQSGLGDVGMGDPKG